MQKVETGTQIGTQTETALVIDDSPSLENNNDKTEVIEQKLPYQFKEWMGLIERSNTKYIVHFRTSRFWQSIYHFFGISMIILSSIITADGIGDIFTKNIIMGFGIIMIILSSVNTLLNPSSNYTSHFSTSKRYRELYHKVRRCNNMNDFITFQNDFENIEQDAPDVPIFMYKVSKNTILMNPLLQRDFTKHFEMKTIIV